MVTQKVAFQGEPGAYGEMATLSQFPKAELLPAKSFQIVFQSLESGAVDFAVIPIENSIEGSVNETYDLLLNTNMVVCGEVYQRIRHCLIINPGADNSKVKSAYSHPQALAQCRVNLQRRNLEPIPTYDTAGAVKMIKEKKLNDAAAIASKRVQIFMEWKFGRRISKIKQIIIQDFSLFLKYSQSPREMMVHR